jgi:hypothetical protein
MVDILHREIELVFVMLGINDAIRLWTLRLGC